MTSFIVNDNINLEGNGMENKNIEKLVLKELSVLYENNEIEKIKECLKIIKINDEFKKDDEACLEIIKKVINSEEEHTMNVSTSFVERFWKYYSDKDLTELDKYDLNIRIKEGVTFISQFDLEEKSELASKIISDDTKNLGEVCRYLYCISRLDNVNQVDALDRIVQDETINLNSFELLAIPLVLRADDKDLSKINDLLDFSHEMEASEMKQNLKKLSRTKSIK